MRKMFVIAVREYLAAVRTKSFLLTLVVIPILMGGSIFMHWLLRDYHDTKTKKFAVVDRTPDERLYPAIEKAVQGYNDATIDPATRRAVLPRFEIQRVAASENNLQAIEEQRLQLSERVRRGELFGFLDISADILQPVPESSNKEEPVLRYQSNSPRNQTFPRLIKEPLLVAIEALRLEQAHIQLSPEKLRQIVRPAFVESMGLTRRNPVSGKIEDGTMQGLIIPVVAPIILMGLMLVIVMLTAAPLMQGVVEEKMQRIAEVLLGSIRPFPLMLGKLLGMTAVSLTITAVYLGSGYGAAREYGFTEYVPAYLLGWFAVYQVLAALMYGSLFIAVGAACTDMKETQNLMWPVVLLAMIPMFFVGSVSEEPNSALSVSLSFFPFATPMLMIMRQSVPPGAPSWQPLLGVMLVLATTLLCVWAAGRIFRVGILMQGKGAKLGEMLRWVLHG